MAFNQVSPLTQQFSTQQRVPDFHQSQFNGQNFSGNQFYGPYPENQTYCYGNNLQSNYSGVNQINNYEQREFEHEVHSLKEINYQIESVRKSLQQDVVLENNSQISHQINEFVLNHTERALEFIQQVIRMTQQHKNQVDSPHERQAYQQRENQLFQLAEIKNQVHKLIQQRKNNFNYDVNQQIGHRAMHLIHQAQDLTRDIMNQVEFHMNSRFNNHNNQNYLINSYRNVNQWDTQSPFGMQNYYDNTYKRGISSPLMRQSAKFGF